MDPTPAGDAPNTAENSTTSTATTSTPAATAAALDLSNSNTTAIEAISERLTEVTALAEQLDRALAAARLDPTAPPPPPSVEDATDVPDTATVTDADAAGGQRADGAAEDASTAVPAATLAAAADSQAEHSDATTTEEWRATLDLADGPADIDADTATRGRQQAEPQAAPGPGASRAADDRSESDDFITASECTCTPPSRSSSFHTASEGGGASGSGLPWWDLGPTSEEGDDEAVAAGAPACRVSKQVQTLPADRMMSPPVPDAAAEVKTAVHHHLVHLPDHEVHAAGLEDGEREVLAGVLVQREVRETRQLLVRRGGGETRAESELSCSRIEAQHINNACNASTSSNTSAASTLSSGTRGALDAVLLVGQDDVDAAYRQQLEESLPLPLPLDLDLDLQLPSPLAFADPPAEYVPEYASEYDEHVDLGDMEDMPPPPPQELLDGLKEVSLRDENANHVVLSVLEPPPPPPPPLQSARFMPHIMRHAIKGVF